MIQGCFDIFNINSRKFFRLCSTMGANIVLRCYCNYQFINCSSCIWHSLYAYIVRGFQGMPANFNTVFCATFFVWFNIFTFSYFTFFFITFKRFWKSFNPRKIFKNFFQSFKYYYRLGVFFFFFVSFEVNDIYRRCYFFRGGR